MNKFVIYSNTEQAYLEYDFAGWSWVKGIASANKFSSVENAQKVLDKTDFKNCIIAEMKS